MSVRLLDRGSDTDVSNLGDIEISAFQGSCQFINLILPFSIATVLSRRVSFDQKYLKEYNMLDVPYACFRSTLPPSHCAYKAEQNSLKMKKYINEKHLKMVSLIIESCDDQQILEKYAFKLTYNPDGDGSFKRGRNAELIASKFFQQINALPTDNSHSEEMINILFEWEFYETIPRAELQLNFKPSKPLSKGCTPYKTLASMKTNFHKLDVYVAFPAPDPEPRQPEPQDDIYAALKMSSQDLFQRRISSRLALSKGASSSF